MYWLKFTLDEDIEKRDREKNALDMQFYVVI